MAVRLYWWQEKRSDGNENYGDLLSKYLVEKISGKKVISVPHPSSKWYKYFYKHYLVIGSIITAANRNSVVWGSGIIKKDETIRKATFLAVRGPKTRQRILDLGYKVPEVYGDPAIVLPRYYNPDVKKKFKIGVIPHYVDYKAVKEHLAEDTHVTIINLLTKSVEATTREILECDHIISSSLHGVIVAQAYGVPALWIKFSDKLSGDNIKFYDYFESVGIDFNNEQRIDVNTLNYETMQHLLSTNKDVLLPEKDILIQLQDGLLKACPFKK